MTDYEKGVLGLLSVIAMATTVIAVELPTLDRADRERLSDISAEVINGVARMVPHEEAK